MTTLDKTKRILKTLQSIENTNKRSKDTQIENKGKRAMKVCQKLNVLVRPIKIYQKLTTHEIVYNKATN